MTNRKGFTLIELLIVVVIIGILAAIAIPKFAATKDKAKLASIKTDIRNFMTAEEGYFSDFSSYGQFSDLQTNGNFTLSSGNAASGSTATTSGYTITVTNSSIASARNACNVVVGGAAFNQTTDGVIICP